VLKELSAVKAPTGQSPHAPSEDNDLFAGQGGKARTVADTALGPPSSEPTQPAAVWEGKKPAGQKQSSCPDTAVPVEDCPRTGHSAHAPLLLKEPLGHAPNVSEGEVEESITMASDTLPPAAMTLSVMT
jgi:hypothetical protein